QRAVDEIDLVLVGKFLDHLRATRSVGAIIFDEDFNRAAIDATCIIDRLHGSCRGALVPAAIGSTDTGAMRLKADLDRSGGLRLGISYKAGCGADGCGGAKALQGPAA